MERFHTLIGKSVSFVEKAATIFNPTPKSPLCCFSMYLAEVKNEHTATGNFSEFIPVPLSSHERVHRSFA